MIEMVNYFIYKNSIKIISLFGYNRFTYKIFSFFYGLGYKHSFGCIRLEPAIANEKNYFLNEGDIFMYIEFMPWSYGNYIQTKDKHIRKKIMLFGAEDFLDMTNFLIKNKETLPKTIISYSNKRIALLIQKKLHFEFIDFKNVEEVMKKCNGDVVKLKITVEQVIENKRKTEKVIERLKPLNFK